MKNVGNNKEFEKKLKFFFHDELHENETKMNVRRVRAQTETS
jgi:hypothetical protein